MVSNVMSRHSALLFVSILAAIPSVAWAEKSQEDCAWFPQNCNPQGPSRQYTIVKLASSPEAASSSARAEANTRCQPESYEALKLRFAKIRTQWQATLTVACTS